MVGVDGTECKPVEDLLRDTMAQWLTLYLRSETGLNSDAGGGLAARPPSLTLALLRVLLSANAREVVPEPPALALVTKMGLIGRPE